MAKKTYRVIGIPIGAPFSVLTDRKVGDVFEVEDLDKDVERLLVGAQSLQVVPAREARELLGKEGDGEPVEAKESEPQAQSKDEPQAEEPAEVMPSAPEPIQAKEQQVDPVQSKDEPVKDEPKRGATAPRGVSGRYEKGRGK